MVLPLGGLSEPPDEKAVPAATTAGGHPWSDHGGCETSDLDVPEFAFGLWDRIEDDRANRSRTVMKAARERVADFEATRDATSKAMLSGQGRSPTALAGKDEAPPLAASHTIRVADLGAVASRSGCRAPSAGRQ